MKGLTERQSEILQFISDYTEENSCPPTVRESANRFGISVSTMQSHIDVLQKKGYLTKSENQSRSLKVVNSFSKKEKFRKIPILGYVAAGKPIFCDENYQNTIMLSEPFVKPGENYFALYVKGHSMIGAGINDGDLAIIKQQETAQDGDIVVALLEDSVTLKRYFREALRVRLQSENPAFKPIYSQDVRILGKLAHIIREY